MSGHQSDPEQTDDSTVINVDLTEQEKDASDPKKISSVPEIDLQKLEDIKKRTQVSGHVLYAFCASIILIIVGSYTALIFFEIPSRDITEVTSSLVFLIAIIASPLMYFYFREN